MRHAGRLALILLAILVPVFASGQTSVEARCTELGTNCKCSEPLDADNDDIQQLTYPNDLPQSPDATECWGRPDFQGIQVADSPPATVLHSVPAWWTPGGFALEQHAGAGGVWLNAENVVFGSEAFTETDQVQCYRFYKQIDASYGSAGGDPEIATGACPNTTWRNKIISATFANQEIQLSEAGFGPCPESGSWQPFSISVDSGPGSPLNQLFEPSLDHGACIDSPCRIELCIDSTDLSIGENVEYRSRICRESEGAWACSTAATGILGDVGAPVLPDTWGGNLLHSSPHGGARFAFFMVARWQSDSDQWIGPAEEVELPEPTLGLGFVCGAITLAALQRRRSARPASSQR